MTPKIGIVEAYKFENYKKAIERHGGQVKKLLIGGEQAVNRYIDQIDGLLLPGGGDIDPDIFREEQHCKTENINRAKDEFEMSLFKKAMKKDMPVFGICRGIQIMNVAIDGSLYQHIPEHLPLQFPDFPKHKANGVDEMHDIKIKTGSLLNEIIDESVAEVNSSHHQAVKVIGKGLVVTAQSEDGIIEAMEYPSKSNPFVIGVQSHPERMWIDKNRPELGLHEHAEKLFKAFINAATT